MYFSACAGSILKHNRGKSFFLFPITYAISSLPTKTANACTLRNGLDTGYFAAYLEGHGSV
jgi:hypothetical protein